MAQSVFIIRFPSPASTDLMHRVLNYVEDVYRGLYAKNIGSLSDIDRYADGCFTVRVSSPRHLGEVRSLISTLLVRHHLENEAVVNRAGHQIRET